MSKIDLHVHSKYSEEVSEQYLRKIGAAESFTEPEFIYRTAKERGMSFVTLTDHNRVNGSLMLKEKYPQDVITGMEATAYFPEDGCKIHVLVYGLNEKEYEDIQRLRLNIYDLRDYLKLKDLAYSVAHATYSGSDKLNLDKLEKLILLFDVFEGINGGRSRMNNEIWMKVIGNLTPSHIEDLYRKHRIEPFSADPWVKGFTGGSDDHAGLFIGNTFTESAALTPAELLDSLKNKKTTAAGKHNDFGSFAFTIFKIAHDLSRSKKGKKSSSLVNQVTELIFDKKSLRFRDKVKVRILRYLNRRKKHGALRHVLSLIEKFGSDRTMSVNRKLELVYETMADVCDDYLGQLITSAGGNLEKGNLARLVKDMSASITGLFLTLPFFATLRHLCKGRELIKDLSARFADILPHEKKRVLWFTDTLNNNDPAGAVLNEIGGSAASDGKLRIAVPMDDKIIGREKLPACVMGLPVAMSFGANGPEGTTFHVPSLLKSLKTIYEFDPDEIYVSTFGPAGLTALLASRLLDVPCTAVFHQEHYAQIKGQIDAESINALFDGYTRWFYGMADTVSVATDEQAAFFRKKGIESERISIADPRSLLSGGEERETIEIKDLDTIGGNYGKDYTGGSACA